MQWPATQLALMHSSRKFYEWRCKPNTYTVINSIVYTKTDKGIGFKIIHVFMCLLYSEWLLCEQSSEDFTGLAGAEVHLLRGGLHHRWGWVR